MRKIIICVRCPVGCQIQVEEKNSTLHITGNECKIGEEYARQEVYDPRRILTTTVFVNGGTHPLLPVRSKQGIPKHLLREGVIMLSRISVDAPVKCGEVVYKNICGTGVDIIASRDVHEAGK